MGVHKKEGIQTGVFGYRMAVWFQTGIICNALTRSVVPGLSGKHRREMLCAHKSPEPQKIKRNSAKTRD